jgi:hypothetical protein
MNFFLPIGVMLGRVMMQCCVHPICGFRRQFFLNFKLSSPLSCTGFINVVLVHIDLLGNRGCVAVYPPRTAMDVSGLLLLLTRPL